MSCRGESAAMTSARSRSNVPPPRKAGNSPTCASSPARCASNHDRGVLALHVERSSGRASPSSVSSSSNPASTLRAKQNATIDLVTDARSNQLDVVTGYGVSEDVCPAAASSDHHCSPRRDVTDADAPGATCGAVTCVESSWLRCGQVATSMTLQACKIECLLATVC